MVQYNLQAALYCVWMHMEHRYSIWYWNVCVFPLLILYQFHQGRKLYCVIIKYFQCNFMPLYMWSHCMCTAHSEYIYCIMHGGKSLNTEAYFLTLQDTHVSWDAQMQKEHHCRCGCSMFILDVLVGDVIHWVNFQETGICWWHVSAQRAL